MTVTLWENDVALEDSESTARSARNRAAGAVDGSVLSVEKFKVLLELGPADERRLAADNRVVELGVDRVASRDVEIHLGQFDA